MLGGSCGQHMVPCLRLRTALRAWGLDHCGKFSMVPRYVSAAVSYYTGGELRRALDVFAIVFMYGC